MLYKAKDEYNNNYIHPLLCTIFHYIICSFFDFLSLIYIAIYCRCGKCRRYMKYIQTKPSRMHCAHCNETYNLPQNGNIRIYKELKCPLDDFELLSWSTGTRGKSYTFCPYCYNNPPFRYIYTVVCIVL